MLKTISSLNQTGLIIPISKNRLKWVYMMRKHQGNTLTHLFHFMHLCVQHSVNLKVKLTELMTGQLHIELFFRLTTRLAIGVHTLKYETLYLKRFTLNILAITLCMQSLALEAPPFRLSERKALYVAYSAFKKLDSLELSITKKFLRLNLFF